MPHRRKILIVEDEPLIAMSLAEMTEELGYEPLGPVMSEPEAIDEARRQRPDAILMDIRLANGGSGLSAARQIRAVSDTPIVFCTAYAEEHALRQEVVAFGRAKLIEKPVVPTLLGRALAEVTGS